MLIFEREKIKDIILEEPHKKARNCSSYKVKKGNSLVVQIYGGDNFTFIKSAESLFIIERHRSLFEINKYRMHNHSTGEMIGEYKFPKLSDDCTLSLTNGDTLLFSTLNFHHNRFKPSTQVRQTFMLSYKADNIFYSGNLYKLGGFVGTIETTNENLVLPLAAGIFIIEERFRLIAERSG